MASCPELHIRQYYADSHMPQENTMKYAFKNPQTMQGTGQHARRCFLTDFTSPVLHGGGMLTLLQIREGFCFHLGVLRAPTFAWQNLRCSHLCRLVPRTWSGPLALVGH